MRSAKPKDPAPKSCAVCGREIEWRKKWERSWPEIKYCSDRCRAAKGGVRPELAEAILQLLGLRARDATICPSEVLPLALKSDPAEMEEVRQAARRLVHEGRIEILQKGRVVDPSTARGPIRLRLKA